MKSLEARLKDLIQKGEQNSVEFYNLVYAIYYTPGTTHKNRPEK